VQAAWGSTALHDAVCCGAHAAVEALLALGARQSQRAGDLTAGGNFTPGGCTPLHQAARRGDERSARLLLANYVSAKHSVFEWMMSRMVNQTVRAIVTAVHEDFVC
jgi:hypothetical protein